MSTHVVLDFKSKSKLIQKLSLVPSRVVMVLSWNVKVYGLSYMEGRRLQICPGLL